MSNLFWLSDAQMERLKPFFGVPPLKWSTHWDRNILFRRTIRWQASETNRKTSF